MNIMICMRGEPEQIPYLPEIVDLGAGIELQSYGMVGIKSQQDWQTRLARHQAIRALFQGPVAVHGPFIGMDYAHVDHMIRDVVRRRLDMTFDAAVKLGAGRLILHTGHRPEVDLFSMQESWLRKNVEFWQGEIRRWAEARITIVLENETEKLPDLAIRLIDEVASPALKLCLDIGHHNVFSSVDAPEWVRRVGDRLAHVHLHDNDGTGDWHWPVGRGTIEYEPFYAALERHAPGATISLEVEDEMDVQMGDLRRLASRFRQARS
jgi:sugar phosphate isomerase/epimerase